MNNHILKLSGLKIKKLENRLEDIIFKTAEVRIRDFVHHFVPLYGTDKGDYYEASLFLTDKDIASNQHRSSKGQPGDEYGENHFKIKNNNEQKTRMA